MCCILNLSTVLNNICCCNIIFYFVSCHTNQNNIFVLFNFCIVNVKFFCNAFFAYTYRCHITYIKYYDFKSMKIFAFLHYHYMRICVTRIPPLISPIRIKPRMQACVFILNVRFYQICRNINQLLNTKLQHVYFQRKH